MRVDQYEKNFDPRDYQRDKPLGFATLANKWLERKKEEVRDFNSIKNHFGYAISFFQNTNIKAIQFDELDEFRIWLPSHLVEKSKANIFTDLHSFFVWVSKKKRIPMPDDFPKIKFELKRRKTITHEQQQEILAWLKEHAPFKVWLGIKWLMTYISIRPGELIEIKEGDIDREQEVVYVRDFKGKRIKTIPLIGEDSHILGRLPKSLPHIYLFRQEPRRGVATYQRGKRFGKRCLYTWWIRACGALVFTNIDLYGGTRHSRAQILRRKYKRTPEEIKRATMHTTTSSFNRYYEDELEDLREIYSGEVLVNSFKPSQKAKLLKLNGKNGRHDGI